MLFEGYTGGGGKDMIDGLMSSGDVGYLDDQNRLFVEGRDDDMIVSGGENVFPQEVEDLIARQDGVDEVAVIGVDDEKFGQRLKAYVVKKKGASVTEDAIKQDVKSNLARYKVPREVEFIDELPRNATGKVLKRELKEQHEEKEGRRPSRRRSRPSRRLPRRVRIGRAAGDRVALVLVRVVDLLAVDRDRAVLVMAHA